MFQIQNLFLTENQNSKKIVWSHSDLAIGIHWRFEIWDSNSNYKNLFFPMRRH